RCLSDWSSDVCSSDLNGLRFTLTLAEPVPGHIEEDVLKVGRSLHPLTLESLVEQPLDESVGRLHRQDLAVVHDRDPVAEGLSLRSEERRVGKGCRRRL